jgi:cytochrome d ubiquinol oxidase subunit II
VIGFWYAVAAFMLSTYVVLDGRNFGVGMLHLALARTPSERREVVAAMGPLWLWHEVWLVGFGGVLFAAFPRLFASAFSGYYLALFLVLWCAILRGMALELGGHVNDPLWRLFWDAVFFLSSVLLAFLFGVALGNVIRGVPLQPDGTFHMAFFTDMRPRGHVGLLDWYTVPVGLFCALVLAAHGATYLASVVRAGNVRERARRVAPRLWAGASAVFPVISVLTWRVRPELFAGLLEHPLALIGAAAALATGALMAAGFVRGHEKRALAGSCALIATVLGSGAAALCPVMLFSTLDPADALTATRVAAPHEALAIAAVWWPVAVGLSLAYAAFIRRYYRRET